MVGVDLVNCRIPPIHVFRALDLFDVVKWQVGRSQVRFVS
jgi:hypothetical protein